MQGICSGLTYKPTILFASCVEYLKSQQSAFSAPPILLNRAEDFNLIYSTTLRS